MGPALGAWAWRHADGCAEVAGFMWLGGLSKRSLGSFFGMAVEPPGVFPQQLEKLGVLPIKLRGGLGPVAGNLPPASPRFHMKVPHLKAPRFPHKGSGSPSHT